MSRALLLLLLALMPAGAQEYWHRLTGSFGALNPLHGYQANTFNSAPMLSFDYGFRFHRYIQADVGADIGFANEKVSSGTSESEYRRNIYIWRFGYRGIVPLWHDRIEASAGAGAGHSYLKPTIPGYEVWLVYGQLGANYAIDRNGRYRAGVTVRWYRDPIGVPVQQWLTVGAEFSYSFGRY